jgi:hypothetical protein
MHRRPAETTGLAWFISPHGLGHATRAAAVMAACSAARERVVHHVFSSAPEALFRDSLVGVSFELHRHGCDVGMVQHTPLMEDVSGTVRALDRFEARRGAAVERLAAIVEASGCRAVICDIAPLGLEVADRVGVPGILIENFTWNWVYRAYGDCRLDEHGARMAADFDRAALRIQTEPVCSRATSGRVVPPVARPHRTCRRQVRRLLGLSEDQRMVLLGPIEDETIVNKLVALRLDAEAVRFVMPNLADVGIAIDGPLIRVPFSGRFYHPDLVAAADVIIAKLGYSTVAEVYHADTAFAYLQRPRFPESPILESFVREHIPSAPLSAGWLDDPKTADVLAKLLHAPRATEAHPNGAPEAAGLILRRL